MSTQTHCDRCGKNSTEKFYGYERERWIKIHIENPVEPDTRHDLCPVCAVEINRWIKEPPPRAMPA